VKIKLDENLPARLAERLQQAGHDVETVQSEGLVGCPDAQLREVVRAEGRFLITQDLDFSDTRRFRPGTHAGLLLIRLRQPGANALLTTVESVLAELEHWAGCFVVLTEHKLRVQRP
jgi:predicted nuclease of predicted toxin-antitoxin system